MATLEEIYDKALSDEAERAEFTQALQNAEDAASFLAQRGCDATVDDLAAYVKERAAARVGELTDDELDAAGGVHGWEVFASVCTVGILCGAVGLLSLTGKYILGNPVRETDTGSDICVNI